MRGGHLIEVLALGHQHCDGGPGLDQAKRTSLDRRAGPDHPTIKSGEDRAGGQMRYCMWGQ
ncbi:MAG: hypothetical protein NVSMB29_19100 [Candidatus Dormibacteria bacterium]